MLLFYIFVSCVIVQYCFALFFIRGIKKLHHYTQPAVAQPVSVIICAHNESANLKKNLPAVLEQNYGAPFQVLVVNDTSQDDTEEVLRLLEEKYPHLEHISIGGPGPAIGKRFALDHGAEYARYDFLLFTDADCIPASKNWLQLMVAPLFNGKEIVIGLGAYTNSGGLLQSFISWETLHTFMQFASYTGNGMPYMATGRNLACTYATMQQALAHPLWHKLSSGHDDLIVQASGTGSNTAVVFNKDAHTISTPKATWKEWVAQKKRHVTTGKHYRPLQKYMLGLYALTHAAVWLLAFPLVFTVNVPIVIILFIFRSLLFSAAFTMTAIKTRQRIKGVLMHIGDFGWMIYNFAFLPYIAWKNKTSWK